MKIVHIDLSGTFNEEMTYQESMIAKYNVLDGHDVVIITTCYRWNKYGNIEKVHAGSYNTKDGYKVIRLEYVHRISEFLTKKIRNVNEFQFESILNDISPDIIILHGPQTYVINYVKRYVERNDVKFVVDVHANFENSARNIISYYLLHRVIYNVWIKRCYRTIYKIYYIGELEKDFMNKVYNIDDEKMEYLPLGGEIIDGDKRDEIRKNVRAKEAIMDDEVLFIIAGKFNKDKKLSNVLRVFSKTKLKARLIIIGSIQGDIKDEIDDLLKSDARIRYNGFLSGNELTILLNSADVYLQPFNLSAIVQNALCAGCVLVLKDCSSYRRVIDGNGYLVNNDEELGKALDDIGRNKELLEKMKKHSLILAKEKYDYAQIARTIIS